MKALQFQYTSLEKKKKKKYFIICLDRTTPYFTFYIDSGSIHLVIITQTEGQRVGGKLHSTSRERE